LHLPTPNRPFSRSSSIDEWINLAPVSFNQTETKQICENPELHSTSFFVIMSFFIQDWGIPSHKLDVKKQQGQRSNEGGTT